MRPVTGLWERRELRRKSTDRVQPAMDEHPAMVSGGRRTERTPMTGWPHW